MLGIFSKILKWKGFFWLIYHTTSILEYELSYINYQSIKSFILLLRLPSDFHLTQSHCSICFRQCLNILLTSCVKKSTGFVSIKLLSLSTMHLQNTKSMFFHLWNSKQKLNSLKVFLDFIVNSPIHFHFPTNDGQNDSHISQHCEDNDGTQDKHFCGVQPFLWPQF